MVTSRYLNKLGELNEVKDGLKNKTEHLQYSEKELERISTEQNTTISDLFEKYTEIPEVLNDFIMCTLESLEFGVLYNWCFVINSIFYT